MAERDLSYAPKSNNTKYAFQRLDNHQTTLFAARFVMLDFGAPQVSFLPYILGAARSAPIWGQSNLRRDGLSEVSCLQSQPDVRIKDLGSKKIFS
jgi:hypothetical protein